MQHKTNKWYKRTKKLLVGFALISMALPYAQSQSSFDPSTSKTFEQAISGMPNLHWYSFGTGSGSTISNLSQLSAAFNPYGIAGAAVAHEEWERYQPFNPTNFVFTSNSLDLTATIPAGGGVFPGGINSGQIWSKETFRPGSDGHNVYAFMIRMKWPGTAGMWPAIWFYTQQPGQDDGSEVDLVEFFVMQWQNQYDWTGYDNGPGPGSVIYSIKNNQYVWHPGIDFSADYHDYELIWTPDTTYKYVDGQLVVAQRFQWTARGSAQVGINLAVGSNASYLPGLIPQSLNQFPAVMSVQYMSIWAQ